MDYREFVVVPFLYVSAMFLSDRKCTKFYMRSIYFYVHDIEFVWLFLRVLSHEYIDKYICYVRNKGEYVEQR